MNFTALRCRFKSIIKGNLKLTAWATKLPSCTTKVVSHSVNEKETTVSAIQVILILLCMYWKPNLLLLYSSDSTVKE